MKLDVVADSSLCCYLPKTCGPTIVTSALDTSQMNKSVINEFNGVLTLNLDTDIA